MAPPTPAVLPDPVPTERHYCRHEPLRTAAEAAPLSLDQLRSLIGASVDAEESLALLGRLGEAREEREDGATERVRRSYERYGVVLAIDDRVSPWRIVRVELTTRTRLAYRGALPEQLDFELSWREVFARLGQPDEGRLRTYAWTPNQYSARGLAVAFDTGGCLAEVIVQPAVGANQMRLAQVHSAVERRDQLGGVSLRFVRDLGALPADTTHLWIGVELTDEKGRPVGRLDGEGKTTSPARFRYDDRNEGSTTGGLFLPFVALPLAPGARRLRAHVVASVATRARPEPAPIEIVGATSFELAFDMPQLWRARVGVHDAAVKERDYDTKGPTLRDPLLDKMLTTNWSRSDLRWSVIRVRTLGADVYNVTFRSKARQDTFRASWSELSTGFVSTLEDSFDVCLEDEDIGLTYEGIGCFAMTLERARQIAASRTSLESGDVRALRLAKPQLTPLTFAP